MARGQKATPRREWAETTKQKQIQWQKENRAKLSADLPKQEGDSFRDICKRNNVSVSAALSVFVRTCIDCNSLDVIRDGGTTAAGSCRGDDGRRDGDDFTRDGRAAGYSCRDDPPGQKNHDPAFPQGDQANENDTPGTVDIPGNASD